MSAPAGEPAPLAPIDEGLRPVDAEPPQLDHGPGQHDGDDERGEPVDR